MNGDVNGTSEGSVHTVSPLSLSPALEKSNQVCAMESNSESSNHADSNHNQEPRSDRDSDSSTNDNSTNSPGETQDEIMNKPISETENSNHVSENQSTDIQIKLADTEQVNIKSESEDKNDLDASTFNKNVTNTEESDDENHSEEDSSDEEGSNGSEEPRTEDTVSINTDSEDVSQDSQSKLKSNEVVILENDDRPQSQNGNKSHGTQNSEVHELSDNDDCVVTSDVKSNIKETKPENEPLRRSSRNIKRRTYDNEESDIEEVVMEDPLNQSNDKSKDNKNVKLNFQNNEKKDPTLVIIDTNSILSGKTSKAIDKSKFSTTSTSATLNAQSLYQSIAARGTTITPVSNKKVINSSTQSSIPQQPLILPSLTDDMFVVEAPSFIVPYVYEKPSITPFREFVDNLGKELEDEKNKLLKEQMEKKALEKEEIKSEEKDDESEKMDVDEPAKGETEAPAVESEAKEGEEKKKSRKRRKHEEDDDSWDGESASSDDDVLSDEEQVKTVVIKDKDDAIEELKDIIGDLNADKISGGKTDNYFDCTLGKFFVNIGVSLVQEFVQNDLLKQQNRKLYKEKKRGENTRATETAISSLMKNLEFSKKKNEPFTFPQKKCEFCSFKTDSILSLSHHLETPHMKNNIYKCNSCPFEIRSPHDILYHMEAEHNIRGRLERAPAYHQCANCPFEDNGKGKLARHMIPCAKKFKPEYNLAPPIEWEPPAKIPKIARARNNMMGTNSSAFNRAQVANNIGRPPINIASMMPGTINNFRARGRSPMSIPPRSAPVHGTPIIRGGVMIRHNANTGILSNNYPIMHNIQPAKNSAPTKTLQHQPSISITPLPRPQQPPQVQTMQQTKGTFVICEICDGYIKDLEQLRNHMQWIHRVKIHPKMIYNRPPLNCQKCQFRFFTDKGLERHLLGSHGLVTSSMQDAANEGKDAGRCPVCGRVYQWKLLDHVSRDHGITLKPAHLSYKCTVCTATFSMYKQFENHVYSAHSVVAKRVMDKTKTAAPVKTTPV